MNKRAVLGATAALILLGVLAQVIFGSSWGWFAPAPGPVPFDPQPSPGGVDPGSLNYVLFEQYGLLLIVLAVLMFGAMIGGIVVAREEIEKDEVKEKEKEEGKE